MQASLGFSTALAMPVLSDFILLVKYGHTDGRCHLVPICLWIAHPFPAALESSLVSGGERFVGSCVLFSLTVACLLPIHVVPPGIQVSVTPGPEDNSVHYLL